MLSFYAQLMCTLTAVTHIASGSCPGCDSTLYSDLILVLSSLSEGMVTLFPGPSYSLLMDMELGPGMLNTYFGLQ